MQMKWLVVLAALLLSACNDTAPEASPKAGESGAAKQDQDHGDHDHDDDHDHEDGDEKDDNSFDGKKVGFNSPTNLTNVAFTLAMQEKDQEKSKATNQEEDDDDDEELSIKEKVAALKKSYSGVMSQYRKDMREEDVDRAKLFKQFTADTQKLFAEAFELANENLDDPDAVSALVWVASSQAKPEMKEKATTLALEKFIDSKEIGSLVAAISRTQTEETEATIKKIIDASPHDEVKAAATYSLARFYSSIISSQEYAKSNDQYKPSEFVQNFDAEAVNLEALYESLSENYADLEAGRGTYGEIAKRALFEIRFLSIGKVAPEIEGKDLDGESFKLSDYRGKVVVIDFWGDW